MNNTIVVSGPNVNTAEVAATDARIERLQKRLQELRAERLSFMPRLSNKERALIVEFEKTVDVSHETAKAVQDLRKNRQLSDEDKDQIAAAKLDHRQEINQPGVKSEAAEMLAKAYLTQYRLTHRKDGRVGLSIRGQI